MGSPAHTEYYVVGSIFEDWNRYLEQSVDIKFVSTKDRIKNTDYRILPISADQSIYFKNDPFCLFTNTMDPSIMDNKGMFAKFMMENFINSIPRVYYYSFAKTKYVDPMCNKCPIKMISKPVAGCGGAGIRIVDRVEPTDDRVISQYIDHTVYYVGHMLVDRGLMIKKIYYSCQNNNDKFIKIGAVTNYTVLEHDQIPADCSIFERIFTKLNYSGFACIDFIIDSGNILIFEINPRIGGSLIKNKKHLDEFFLTAIRHDYQRTDNLMIGG
jgi:hypothetical protein